MKEKQVSGIFIVDKPKGITTNKLIQTIKRNLKVNKIGHAGTLDPLATGVVVVLVNSGTKLSDYFLNQQKSYLVEAQLYVATDSYDADGQVTEIDVKHHVSYEVLNKGIQKYNNYTYDQIPPIYSAIKVKGRKLYDYARNQPEVCSVADVLIAPKKVHIQKLSLLSYDETNGIFRLDARVSKGTYIRSLVVDLAHELDTLAHVINLRRMQSGVFQITQATRVEDLKWSDLIPNLNSVEMNNYHIYELDEMEYKKVIKGQKIVLNSHEQLLFLAYEQELIAIYEKLEDSLYVSVKGGFSN